MTARPLPAGPLVAFYGDDFTGSSAAMEVLAFAGLETVLFLAPPSAERLAAFSGYRGIGIAGIARARSPEWMNVHLPPIFSRLREVGAPIVHYKVCSTFDSAPHIGSIGRAAEIGRQYFEGWTPLVVSDPGMGRFQAFGNSGWTGIRRCPYTRRLQWMRPTWGVTSPVRRTGASGSWTSSR